MEVLAMAYREQKFPIKPLATQRLINLQLNFIRIIYSWTELMFQSSHSIRKTRSSVIYDKTHNVDAVRRLLGQSSVTTMSVYLGVSDKSALELARNIKIWFEGYMNYIS